MKNIEIDQYLSELNLKTFYDHKHYTSLIDSPTGTGKTEMIFRRAQEKEFVIVAFPYTTQVVQQSNKYPEFQTLMDDAKYDDKKSSQIICTYDKLVNLINQDFPLNQYELHLDECHNLYVAADYRDRVMYHIATSIRNREYSKVFLYSSTYEPRYLSNYLIVNEHFAVTKNTTEKDDVMCVNLDSQKLTMNEAMFDYIRQNLTPNEKFLIYRNNKSENVALSELLEDYGYSTMVIDSDSKNETSAIELLEKERLAKKTQVLITTSMLTEGINLLNQNITQIHYIDKNKSAATIRQFASRPRISKHVTLVWYKKDDVLSSRKDTFEEMFDFLDSAEQLEESYNNLVDTIPDKMKNKYINHLLRGYKMYDRTWRQRGFRNVHKKICIDYTRVGNYFYELDVINQSANSNMLGEELEKYNFEVSYVDHNVSNLNEQDIKNSKSKSRNVRANLKAEKLEVLVNYRNNQINVQKRLQELLRKKGKTSVENREIKIAKEWLQLKANKVSEDDIINIIRKNNTHKAKFRSSLFEQQKNDLLYGELTELVTINKKYTAEDRSEILVIAEKNIRDKHSIELNIRKTTKGEIHGKLSKGIFNTLFNTRSHVYSGKHSVSVQNFDPLFFKTTS